MLYHNAIPAGEINPYPAYFDYEYSFRELPKFNTVTETEQPERNKKYRLKEDPQYTSIENTEGLDPILLGVIELMNANPAIKGKFRISSGKRAPRYVGDPSYHPQGKAFDIVAIDGDMKSLEKNIASDARLVSYLKRNGYGFISEIDPEAQSVFNAIGANIHFGPDKRAKEGKYSMTDILAKYGFV